MNRLNLLALGFATTLTAAALAQDPKPGEMAINARKRAVVQVTTTINDNGVLKTVTEQRLFPESFSIRLDLSKCAVVVCDMWDDHWCKKASERCGALAKSADPVLKACRKSGATIIHCPSDCMDFYKDHAARQRMQAIKKVDPPKSKDLPNPSLPVDDSDGGCDDDKPAKQFKAWKRQHEAIAIDADKDYITDSGNEVYSLLAEKKIDTLIVMGVHTNMCVLNRTFAIKQMVKWGKNVYLVRDLTDAMYNPKMKPMVTHARGTEMIIEHIEQHWCPTIESKSMLGK